MKSQYLLLTGIHKTPNYLGLPMNGKEILYLQRNTLFAYSRVYYACIAVFTNTKECQCMANMPLQ